MSVNLTINGVAYPFPVQGDSPPWGTQVTAWATAVTGGMLQKAGGTFTLTADVDFGATYGLKAAKFSTRSANPASSGLLRLANNEAGPTWRDSANSSDLVLKVNASDQLEFNGVPVGGAAAYTADRAIQSDGSGNLEASAVTATELGYVSGVTSSIQTQLDGCVTSVGGTAPVVSSGGTTPSISMHVADATHDGYLSQTDWSTFNAKQPAGSYLTDVTADAPISGSGTSGSHLVISQAGAATDGYLSSTDWNTFNGKLDPSTANATYVPLTSGNYTLARSSGRVTVGNTTTETSLISFTLAAGALGTNRAVRIRLFGIWSHGGNLARTGTIRLKYGSTVLATSVLTAASAVTNGPAFFECELRGNNSASSQIGNIVRLADNNSTFYAQSYGTASEDSSGALTLAVTMQWNAANSSETVSLASEAVLV